MTSQKLYSHRLKNHTTMLIAGPSQSGKTTLTQKIVKDRNTLFEQAFSNVFWFCAYPPKEKIDEVIYKTGAPVNILETIKPESLVIIDDYMCELKNSNELTSIMTKSVHHVPFTLIFITQNVFHKGNDTKTRRMNTTYMILFKNPHDKSQADYLGKEMFPNDKNFLSKAFAHATQEKPFSYLLIDCHQTTPDEIRVRHDITNHQGIPVYKPKSINLTI